MPRRWFSDKRGPCHVSVTLEYANTVRSMPKPWASHQEMEREKIKEMNKHTYLIKLLWRLTKIISVLQAKFPNKRLVTQLLIC